MTQKIVEIRNVTFGYNKHPVLENINLDIFERDYILIMGPNGGGKSTLLKLIMGIIQPWKGSITFGKGIGDRLGYVPQFSEFNRNFPISVLEMVLSGRIHSGNFLKRRTKSDLERAQDILEKLDLADERDANINNLSGGQIQRLLIARALVADPAVLFLDEPTTSIDLSSQSGLLDLLKELNRTTAIIVVTHDPTPFAQAYNHVACINRNLHYHERGELNAGHLESIYGCPVQLLGHGIPHTFLNQH
ncbi:MAG: metal ABC transporter ATP-binding protein [Syntrophales bacterium]